MILLFLVVILNGFMKWIILRMSGLVGVCLGSGPHFRDMLIRVHPTLLKPALWLVFSVTETFPLPPPPSIPCVTFFPRVLRVGTPRPSKKNIPFQLERACVGILRPVLDYVYFSSTSRLVFVRRCGFVLLLPALSRPSSCGPVALLHCPSVPAVWFLFVGVASFRSCPPYRIRRPVAPWPYYIVPPYRPSRFCSSVWLRFAPARLIASVILWPRGLTKLSLRTARFFPRRLASSRNILYTV